MRCCDRHDEVEEGYNTNRNQPGRSLPCINGEWKVLWLLQKSSSIETKDDLGEFKPLTTLKESSASNEGQQA